MKRKMKIWGGYQHRNGKQCRVIVATHTKKRACELLSITISELNNYYGETRNNLEVDTALMSPEVVFVASSRHGKDFVPVTVTALKIIERLS